MEFALGFTLTQWIVVSTLAAWLIYTANAQKIRQRTISATIRDMAWSYNFFPFCWGMLMTHWFAPKQQLIEGLWGWGIALPMILILLGVDVYWNVSKRERHWIRWPFWYFLLGLPFGYFFWPQASLHAPF